MMKHHLFVSIYLLVNTHISTKTLQTLTQFWKQFLGDDWHSELNHFVVKWSLILIVPVLFVHGQMNRHSPNLKNQWRTTVSLSCDVFLVESIQHLHWKSISFTGYDRQDVFIHPNLHKYDCRVTMMYLRYCTNFQVKFQAKKNEIYTNFITPMIHHLCFKHWAYEYIVN